jgi:hypothetical protein
MANTKKPATKQVIKKTEKTVSATRTPAKKTVSPEPVVPLAEHDKVKSELVSAKLQTSKEKRKRQEAAKAEQERQKHKQHNWR